MAKKACLVSKGKVKNTGKECDTSMLATAMLVALEPSVTFTDADMVNPFQWLNKLIHDKKAFPLFGQKAPIRTITNDAAADVTVTMDDGSIIFVRNGIYNRTFETTSGGLCYAASLQSFLNSGYSVLEIDIKGQGLARKNSDTAKTYGGIITDYMSAPSPLLADFKSVYRNRFSYSFNPSEMVNNGVIFEGLSSLLSLGGLIDARIVDAGASTTTKLKIKVQTECAEADLIALFGAPLAATTNFVVNDASTGAVVPITAAAIVGDHIELTGTFVSAKTYNVYGSVPSVWFTANLLGYDASSDFAAILVA